jgi:hypothetical protein
MRSMSTTSRTTAVYVFLILEGQQVDKLEEQLSQLMLLIPVVLLLHMLPHTRRKAGG